MTFIRKSSYEPGCIPSDLTFRPRYSPKRMHTVQVDAGRHIFADPDPTAPPKNRSNIKCNNLNPVGNEILSLASSSMEV